MTYFNKFVGLQETANINVRGGEQLENRGFGGKSFKFYLTAGIGCTTSDGHKGLVANGHGMKVMDFIYLNDTAIGYVAFVQCGSGDGDYSIIILADNVTANGETHYMGNMLRVNHSLYDPEKGDKLFKCTQLRGYADLTVVDTNVKKTPLIDGEYVDVYGLVKAKVTLGNAGSGDSGAGVYHNKNDDPLSFLEFSGIIHGGEHENGELIAYFTPPKYKKIAPSFVYKTKDPDLAVGIFLWNKRGVYITNTSKTLPSVCAMCQKNQIIVICLANNHCM